MPYLSDLKWIQDTYALSVEIQSTVLVTGNLRGNAQNAII